ncbi:Transcription initiation factor TFIID subunit 5, partial [Spiromyces aspiralis]
EGGKKAQEEAKSLLGDFNKGQFNFGLDPIPADSILAPPPRGPDVAAQIQRLKDARKRVVLGPAALPSICMYTIHNTSDSLNCTTVSDDLSIMAGGFSESYVKLWSLKHKPLEGQSDFAWSLQPDKDGDTERPRNHSNDYNRRLIGHSGPVFGLDISFDNKYLISCSEDKTARLWSLDTYTNVVCYKGHNFPVWDVAFGPFSFYFATASHDRTARLWSCDHIYPLRIFAGHLSDVNCVRFHPNSKYIVTGSCDKTARLWDVQRGSCVRVFTGHKDSVGTVAVSPDGRIMASAGYENTIRVWDLGSGRCMSEFSGHTGSIYSLAFSQEGTLLLSGSADQTVRAWDVKRRADSSIHPIIAQKKQNAEDVLNIQRETEDDVSALNGSKMDIGSPTKSEKEAENDKDAANKKPAAKKRDAEGRWKASRVVESEQLLKTWKTKSTPVYSIKFSKRNLAVAVGAFKI